MKKLYIIPSEAAARYMVNKLYDEGYKWSVEPHDKHYSNHAMKALVAVEPSDLLTVKRLSFYSQNDWNESDFDEVYEVEESVDFYVKKKETEKLFKRGNIIVGDFGVGLNVYILIGVGGNLQAVNITAGSTWNSPKHFDEIPVLTSSFLHDNNILPVKKPGVSYEVYDNFQDYLEMVHLVPGNIG